MASHPTIQASQGQPSQMSPEQKPAFTNHPIQPQPYPKQPPQPRLVPFHKGWHVTKIVFRSLDLAFSIIVLALAIYVVIVFGDLLAIVLISPPAILAIIWETAEFITLCARGGRVGIHPGAHVGLHLIIWLAWCVAVGFIATRFALFGYYDVTGYGSVIDTQAAIVAFSSLLLASLTQTAPLSIVHLTLFIGACVDTSRRNSAARPVYVVANGPNGPIFVANQPAVMPQQPAFAYQPGPYQQPGAYQPGMYPPDTYPQSMGPQSAAYPPAAYPPPTQQVRASGNFSTHSPSDFSRTQEQAQTSGNATVSSDNGPSAPQRQSSVSPVDGSYYGPGNEYHQRG
ncbi:hypothetical protein SODALDRAFT_401571 [Sodiomyces alkalinus F11]|uniref:Uncharacterized protein n=1 Tax=Sodiomyces alkalinus (strain CBS 110278 / VKM F-3762 / F11) TaxID=1314773 RepID=A0A3N2PQ90_SODAK|nr:hypothetical protein SODALDRAFT_401571 [Sodiomyces alkalinus F11]ROT36673.1 hypothetical protein SODALDRAFT_401571 [Sodiomyces alkalinus F11]